LFVPPPPIICHLHIPNLSHLGSSSFFVPLSMVCASFKRVTFSLPPKQNRAPTSNACHPAMATGAAFSGVMGHWKLPRTVPSLFRSPLCYGMQWTRGYTDDGFMLIQAWGTGAGVLPRKLPPKWHLLCAHASSLSPGSPDPSYCGNRHC
jgi:hypothetical protein